MRALVLLSLALGCGNAREEESRQLLLRIDAINQDAPYPERKPDVDALAALELKTEELVEVRDTCVAGHRALIEAEENQTRAMALHARALRDHGDEADFPAGVRTEITDALETSDAATERAEELGHKCIELRADLEFSSNR
jgi:hypothetical protein